MIFRLSSSAFDTYYDILHNKSLAVVVKTSICKLSKCVNQIPVKWYHILCWLTEPILSPATRFKINRTELTYWSLRYSLDLRTIEEVLIKSSNMEYCWRRSLRKEWNIHSLKIQNLYIQTTWNCLPENFLTVFYLPEIKENIWSALNKWLTPAVVRESIRSISGIFSSSDILIVAEGLEFFFTFSI